jgi:hypothetical protein
MDPVGTSKDAITKLFIAKTQINVNSNSLNGFMALVFIVDSVFVLFRCFFRSASITQPPWYYLICSANSSNEQDYGVVPIKLRDCQERMMQQALIAT